MTVDRAVDFIQTSEVRPFPCTPIMIYPNECLQTGLEERRIIHTVVLPARWSCSMRESLSMLTTLTSYPYVSLKTYNSCTSLS